MKKYCDACGKEVETKIVSKIEEYYVCGDAIEVEAEVLVCSECGEDVFCEELDSKTLNKAYNIYRTKHRLLFPDEIKEIRKMYGLSQRSFAKLLNWGDKTIYRYENGSIPDKAHNSLLLFIREPRNMRTYLTDNEIFIDEKAKSKLLTVVENLEQNEFSLTERLFLRNCFSSIPSEENGYRSFDYEKFCAMVLYFSNQKSELLKTKLMKLLNYSDMVYYKENGISISGAKYVHFQYGPVPIHFDMLLGTMEADNIVHIEINIVNGYEKHQVIPDMEMPKGVLSKAEIKVLERIYQKFKTFGSVEISEYSHKEKGFSETNKGDIISYSYAKDIDLI